MPIFYLLHRVKYCQPIASFVGQFLNIIAVEKRIVLEHIELISCAFHFLIVARNTIAEFSNVLPNVQTSHVRAKVSALNLTVDMQLLRLRVLGDNIDNARYSICSVERTCRTADNFNTVDVGKVNRQRLPERTTINIVVYRAVVNHDKSHRVFGVNRKVLVRNVIVTTDVDIVVAISLFTDNNTRYQTHSLLNVACTRSYNLIIRKYGSRKWRVKTALGLLRSRCDIFIQKHFVKLVERYAQNLGQLHDIFNRHISQFFV